MKTDIEIAQSAKMDPIIKIASRLGLTEDDIDLYGKYKCKIDLSVLSKNKDEKDGKLILVTAINPTPAGEGKSTVTVGLGDALSKLNKKVVIALRELISWTCFRYKRRGSWGRLRSGCTYGGYKSSLYWRYACYNYY